VGKPERARTRSLGPEFGTEKARFGKTYFYFFESLPFVPNDAHKKSLGARAEPCIDDVTKTKFCSRESPNLFLGDRVSRCEIMQFFVTVWNASGYGKP
jgi:hypothetical protein